MESEKLVFQLVGDLTLVLLLLSELSQTLFKFLRCSVYLDKFFYVWLFVNQCIDSGQSLTAEVFIDTTTPSHLRIKTQIDFIVCYEVRFGSTQEFIRIETPHMN